MPISLKTLLELGTLEAAGYCPKCQGKTCKCEQAFGLEESDASAKAKELNLVHVGFGNYAQKEGGPILYRTIDGVLTKVGETEKAKDPKVIKKTGEEPEASKELEPQDVYGKRQATIKKIGVTDIKLVDEENQIYTFRYNDHPGRLKLSKEEIARLAKDDITNIILDRIKRKIARIKAKQMADAEVQAKDAKK